MDLFWISVQCKYLLIFSIANRVSGLGFFSGGRDNKIIMIDLEGNPISEMLGHEGAVNSLS